MFCAKCGKELPEDAAFCPGCGTQQESRPVDQPFTQPIAQSVASTGKKISLSKNAKLALIGGVALVVVLAVVLLAFGGSSVNKSPETVSTAFFESIFELDAEKMVDCMADPIFNYLVRSMGLPETVSKSDVIDYMQQTFELQGNVILDQFKYREIHSVVLSEHLDIEDLKRYGASEFEMSEITSAVKMKVRFQKPNGGTYSVRVVCAEIDGDWYIWDLDT